MAGAPKKPAGERPPSSGRGSAKKTAPTKTKSASKVTASKTIAKKAPRPHGKAPPAHGKKGRLQSSRAVAKGPVPPRKGRTPTTAPPSKGAPAGRLLAVFAELPTERPLTDEEREAMSKVSETARRLVGAAGPPSRVVASIAEFVDDVRLGRREEPTNQDVRLGLGVLWGEQLRAQVGWRWVHLTYPDGFASYALVPDDRAFACFPLNRVAEGFRPNVTNTSVRVFDSIRSDALPTRKPNAYLAIG